MKRQRAICLVYVLASTLAGACRTEADEECTWDSPSLAPGEKPNGIDPHTVFDLYDASWAGIIHWRSGESSSLTLTLGIVPSLPVAFTTWCGNASRLDQPLVGELHSEDGLVAKLRLDAAVGLSGPEFDPPRVVSASDVTLGPRPESVFAGLANRDAWRLDVELFWRIDEQTGRPTKPDRGAIRAIGTESVASLAGESIEVATFEFE